MQPIKLQHFLGFPGEKRGRINVLKAKRSIKDKRYVFTGYKQRKKAMSKNCKKIGMINAFPS